MVRFESYLFLKKTYKSLKISCNKIYYLESYVISSGNISLMRSEMILAEIPDIFFNTWFYFIIIAILIIIQRFWGKPVPAKQPGTFYPELFK